MTQSSGHVSNRSQVDQRAYLFACSKMRKPTKQDLDAVAAALRGVPGEGFVQVVTFYLSRTGHSSLKASYIREICGWFNQKYTLWQMTEGIRRALENASRIGHVVSSPVYCTLAIHQLATSPAERDAGIGRFGG